jgi:hypothetical protein
MSYDLDLFTPQSKLDPIATIQAAALHSESAETPLNQSIAEKLLQDNDDFQLRSSKDYLEIMDASDGIRISLYPNGGHLAISYWYSDDAGIQAAFLRARRYLGLILANAPYSIYDPQLGRVIEWERDLPMMMEAYKRSFATMQGFSG